jgi:hypothetical protein
MPVVLLTPFFAALTTRIRARMFGQWDGGATSYATLSEPSAALPISQPT